MASDLRFALEFLQLCDYATIMALSAVGYDYILTFSREVEYIWCRRWTWVSTMFVLVRYLGLCWAIIDALVAGTLMSGPSKVMCTTVYLVAIWAFVVFLSAADLMMILRVYTMWGRSRTILRVLLSIYIVQTIVCLIYAGMYINPNTDLSVAIAQIQDFSGCNIVLNVPPNLTIYFMIPRFALSVVLFILALTQTLKGSVAMYKATKHWQPNLYMGLLVKHGIIYFFTSLLYNTAQTILSITAFTTTNPSMVFLDAFIYLIFATIMPRFIISVRELYDRDLRAQWQGVDTGFGLSSQPMVGQHWAVSAIAFADVTPGQDQVVEGDADDSEGVRLGVAADGVRLA